MMRHHSIRYNDVLQTYQMPFADYHKALIIILDLSVIFILLLDEIISELKVGDSIF